MIHLCIALASEGEKNAKSSNSDVLTDRSLTVGECQKNQTSFNVVAPAAQLGAQ